MLESCTQKQALSTTLPTPLTPPSEGIISLHYLLTSDENKNTHALQDTLNRKLTYAQLHDAILAFTSIIPEAQFQKNKHFIVMLENSIELCVCYLAAIYHGCIITPLDPATTQDQLTSYTNLLNTDWIIRDIKEISVLLTAQIRNTQGALSLLKPIHDPQSPAALFFTSGTTGKAKGVYHSAASLLENAYAFQKHHVYTQTVRMLHIMPMWYMAGFLNTLLCPLVTGGSIVIAPQINALSIPRFWSLVLDYDINAVWLSPTMLSLITRLKLTDDKIQSIKQKLTHVFVGTAALTSQVQKAFEEKFQCPCLASYGSTEMLLISCQTHTSQKYFESVGSFLAHTEYCIDEKKHILSIRSPYSFSGYLYPDKFEEASRLQWFTTGDQASINDTQELTIQGRIKDLIIRGGKNIYPIDIESVLEQHPDIQDAAVIGRANAVWGEEVVAFIVTKLQSNITALDLQDYCTAHLPRTHRPVDYYFIQKMPKTIIGKTQKSILAQEYLQKDKAHTLL